MASRQRDALDTGGSLPFVWAPFCLRASPALSGEINLKSTKNFVKKFDGIRRALFAALQRVKFTAGCPVPDDIRRRYGGQLNSLALRRSRAGMRVCEDEQAFHA